MSDGGDKTPMVKIDAINRRGKYAILSDGRITPFVKLFDVDGEEVADIDAAHTAIAEHPDGGWMPFVLNEWESISLH